MPEVHMFLRTPVQSSSLSLSLHKENGTPERNICLGWTYLKMISGKKNPQYRVNIWIAIRNAPQLQETKFSAYTEGKHTEERIRDYKISIYPRPEFDGESKFS